MFVQTSVFVQVSVFLQASAHVSLLKLVCLWLASEKTLAYYEISLFAVNYESLMFYSAQHWWYKMAKYWEINVSHKYKAPRNQ